jgi:hypothetical protein
VITFDALPHPEEALTTHQLAVLGSYLLVGDWESALERAECLLRARAARIVPSYYDLLLDDEKLAGHLLITHRIASSAMVDADEDERFAAHLALHSGSVHHASP